jgi:Ca2+-binding EF-hand superfamily protein
MGNVCTGRNSAVTDEQQENGESSVVASPTAPSDSSALLLKNVRKSQPKFASIENIRRNSINPTVPIVNTNSLRTGIRLSEDELNSVLDKLRILNEKEHSISEEAFLAIAEEALTKRFDRKYFEKVYHAFDVDGSGDVDLVEIAAGLSNLIQGERGDMIRMVFGLFDADNSGSVQMEEMIDFFTKFSMGQSTMGGYKLTSQRVKVLEEHLKRIFTASDLDNNGTLDLEEFIAAVSDVDHPLCMLFEKIADNENL